YDVLRAAGRRDREQHVTRRPERAYLLRKDLDERVIVADRRERRAVGRQRQGGQARPLELEAVQELAREMLRVGRGTAVAAAQDLAVLEQRLRHEPRGCRNARRQYDRAALDGDAVFEMLTRALFHLYVSFAVPQLDRRAAIMRYARIMRRRMRRESS